jgi:putative hydrolase of the HAD superfamily
MIRNIIFDMGGVLMDWNPAKLLEQRNVSGEDHDIMMRELFHETEWIAVDHGVMSEQQAVDSVCARLPQRLKPVAEDIILNWWKTPFDDMPGMEELIHSLKKNGYMIYLLSNASLRQAEYFDRLPASECFSGRITSAEVRMLKPQADIYALCLETFGLAAEECVFIDDSSMNVHAARMAGYSGIVYHGDTEMLIEKLRGLGVRI